MARLNRALGMLGSALALTLACWTGLPASAAGAEKGQAAAPVQDPNGKKLAAAWEEYGFQNWERSVSLFAEVKSSPTATEAQKIQAQIGHIFLLEYRTPGRNPELAITEWEALIPQLTGKFLPFAYMHLGNAYVVQAKPDFEKARGNFQKALELVSDKKSSLGQQAILYYLSSYLMRVDVKEIAAGLVKADELLPLIKGARLAGAGHAMAASMAMCLKDYPRAVKELKEQYGYGIYNRSNLERVLFQLARLNEMELKNYEEAAKYFELLKKDVPTSDKAYYAGLRAAELRKGQIKTRLSLTPQELEKMEMKELKDLDKTSEPVAPPKP